jgi:hypothetical protein
VDILKTRPNRQAADDLPHSDPLKRATGMREQQAIVVSTIVEANKVGAEFLAVAFDGFHCRVADRNEPLFVSFAGNEHNGEFLLPIAHV